MLKGWTKWPSMVGLLKKKPKRVGLLTQAQGPRFDLYFLKKIVRGGSILFNLKKKSYNKLFVTQNPTTMESKNLRKIILSPKILFFNHFFLFKNTIKPYINHTISL